MRTDTMKHFKMLPPGIPDKWEFVVKVAPQLLIGTTNMYTSVINAELEVSAAVNTALLLYDAIVERAAEDAAPKKTLTNT